MIFVMLGTNPYCFKRLIKPLDEYAYTYNEEIIVQLGFSVYRPKNMRFFDFLSHHEIIDHIKKAEIVITQGGYGSIYDCLELKKKVIAVPRNKEFHECSDSGLGQFELVRKLEQENRILALYDPDDLRQAIVKAREFSPYFNIENEISVYISEIIQDITLHKND